MTHPYLSHNHNNSYRSPQQEFDYKVRQFSTADKYSNIELTAQKFTQLFQQNQMLKQFLHQHGLTPSSLPSTHRRSHRVSTTSADNEILRWDIEQRGEYLKKKIEKLRMEKEKQSQAIEKIRNSSRWKSRAECGPVACYKDKYMRLLRLRCPDTEF